MKLSEKFYVKMFNDLAQFDNITKDKWYKSMYRYMIDSKYRIMMDLQQFSQREIYQPGDKLFEVAKRLYNKNPDATVINALRYVVDNVKYLSDFKNYGKTEYWASAGETLERGYDDCDGMNNLVRTLCVYAGVPDFLIYNVIGYCMDPNNNMVGHYWLVYYSINHEKFVAIDSTYYPKFDSIKVRPPFKLTSDKYERIWYLWNEHMTLKQ